VFPLVEENDGSYRRAMRDVAESSGAEGVKIPDCSRAERRLGRRPAGPRKGRAASCSSSSSTVTGPGFSQLFDLLLGSDHVTAAILADAFDVDEIEVVSALAESSKLVRSGLLRVQERPLRIGEPSIHLRADADRVR